MAFLKRYRERRERRRRALQPYVHQGEVDLFDEGSETCLECEGTGQELEPGSKKPTGRQCRACHGIGRIASRPEQQTPEQQAAWDEKVRRSENSRTIVESEGRGDES